MVFTGTDRSSAIDHCPSDAITVRSFIYLVLSSDFFLCVYFLLFLICLSKTNAFPFSFVLFTFKLFRFLLIVSTILSVLVLQIVCFLYFKIFSSIYFSFPIYNSLFFYLFVHYFHLNLFPNLVIYLFLSILFVPFSRCLFSIALVLIFLRFHTALFLFISSRFHFCTLNSPQTCSAKTVLSVNL